MPCMQKLEEYYINTPSLVNMEKNHTIDMLQVQEILV
jgi:hypothetical protein